MNYISLLMAGIFLAGCGIDVVKDDCQAEKYQHLIGKSIDQIDTNSIDVKVRIIKPNTMHDKMFDQNRLNIKTDKKDIVIKVYCG